MEYRIIDSDGCFIVEIKRYLPNKWYSPVSLFEWKSVKYTVLIKAAKEWLERHHGALSFLGLVILFLLSNEGISDGSTTV